jgi:hypothetical protein
MWEFPAGPQYRFADGGMKIYDNTDLLMSHDEYGKIVYHTDWWRMSVPGVPFINWS